MSLIFQQISATHLRSTRIGQKPVASNAFNATLSGPAAEEQFLEQTPWANPQHPIHRLGLSRQNSDRSMINDTFLTPANQSRAAENPQPGGSASTIPEHPSAPVSSAVNTPHDVMSSQTKAEPGAQIYRLQSLSPLETRRMNYTGTQANQTRPASQPREMTHETGSSPLASRIGLANSPPRAASAIPDKISRHPDPSPFGSNKDNGITAGPGFAGAGKFSLM